MTPGVILRIPWRKPEERERERETRLGDDWLLRGHGSWLLVDPYPRRPPDPRSNNELTLFWTRFESDVGFVCGLVREGPEKKEKLGARLFLLQPL